MTVIAAVLGVLVWVAPVGAVVWPALRGRRASASRLLAAGAVAGALPGAALGLVIVVAAPHAPPGSALLYTAGVAAGYGAAVGLAALAVRGVGRRLRRRSAARAG